MKLKNNIEVYLNEELKEEQIKMSILDIEVDDQGYYKYTTKIFEQSNKIGDLILNFIQNDLKETAFFIFKFYGFETLLTENERQKILKINPNEIENLNNTMEKLYNKYKKNFEDYKNQIIDIIEYCLFNEKEEIKGLSPIEKLQIFINKHDIEKYSILKYNQFSKVVKINEQLTKMTYKELIKEMKSKKNNKYDICDIKEVYEIDNFYNLLFLELYWILQEKTYLKKCKNCGKYFITNNSSVIYCDNVFEDNKTCREIGASKVFIKNLEKDEAYNLYRKVYKRKQALAKSKGGKYEIEYNLFKHQGKDKKNAYKLKEITKEEFMEWLNFLKKRYFN